MHSYQNRRKMVDPVGRNGQYPHTLGSSRNNNRGSVGLPGAVDMNIQGRSAVGGRGILLGSNRLDGHGSLKLADFDNRDSSNLTPLIPRQDLIPQSEDIPSDGIVFCKVRNHPEFLVVCRTPEERSRNSERLNLDRRQLDICPYLEQENRLRLLNYQNNNIRIIQNLENLPNLIFLDLYNNKVASLEGALSTVQGLRVLMAGKNRISQITNLINLRKLDVLDLHSNDIREIEGLSSLHDLRVLNLAGNKITQVKNLSTLQSLTELNLRRNNIQKVQELDRIPGLQRLFLSHNQIASYEDMGCVLCIRQLIELSLDSNPVSDSEPALYRQKIVLNIPSLRHLDLKRVSDEERVAVGGTVQGPVVTGGVTGTEREKGFIRDDDGVSLDSSATTMRSLFTKRGGSRGGSPGVGEAGKDADHRPGPLGGAYANNGGVNGSGAPVTLQQLRVTSPPTDHSASNSQTNTPLPQSAFAPLGSSSAHAALKKPPSSADSHSQDLGAAGTGNGNSGGSGILTGVLNSQSKAGLLGRARVAAGNIPVKSMFEIEVIGPNDRLLIVIGEQWEWIQSKRLLANVTEASLERMKRQVILSKFAPNISWLPALRGLRLAHNSIETLHEIRMIGEVFPNLDNLLIKDSSVCALALFRPYVISSFSNLKFFNDVAVTAEERLQALHMLRPVFSTQALVSTQMVGGGSSSGGGPSRGGGLASEAPSSLRIANAQKLTSDDAAVVDDVFAEVKAQALAHRKYRERFEEAFHAAVQKVMQGTVRDLYDMEATLR